MATVFQVLYDIHFFYCFPNLNLWLGYKNYKFTNKNLGDLCYAFFSVSTNCDIQNFDESYNQ